MFNDSTVFKAMQHVEYAKNMWYVSIASEIEGKPPSETVNLTLSKGASMRLQLVP